MADFQRKDVKWCNSNVKSGVYTYGGSSIEVGTVSELSKDHRAYGAMTENVK